MRYTKVSLKEAEKFHGHLGPYLVLGILAGEFALKKLKCKKYFGLKINVWGATQKPKSCLIDGLQLSTGATYGKDNIQKLDGSVIKVEFRNRLNQKRIVLRFKKNVIKRLREIKNHKESEALARELHKTDPDKLFDLI